MEDIGLHLQICELNTLVAGMILYYGYLTGKELSLAEFLEYNKEEFPSVQKIHEQLGRDLFAHQEQAGIHNPYEQERREQDAIRHGDVAALNRSNSGERSVALSEKCGNRKYHIGIADRSGGGSQRGKIFYYGGQYDPAD